jgi:hypothetical protein
MFHVDTGNKDGISGLCKLCDKNRQIKLKESRRNRKYLPVTIGKTCPRCNTYKDASGFHKNITAKDGLDWLCSECSRNKNLIKKYGVSSKMFDAALNNQGGCPICNRSFNGKNRRDFVTDHDHVTRIVRGVLCIECNLGIGMVSENLQTLKGMAQYIGRWKMTKTDSFGRIPLDGVNCGGNHFVGSLKLSKNKKRNLLQCQGNCCKICFSDSRTMVLDHCHDTGMIRDYLCHNCNSSLGLLKHSEQNIEKAIKYLLSPPTMFSDITNNPKT